MKNYGMGPSRRNLEDYLKTGKPLDPESKNSVKSDKFDKADYNSILSEMREMENSESELVKHVETGSTAFEDTFFGLIKAVPKIKDPKDVRPSYLVNRAVMEEAMDLKEFEELRIYTVGDDVSAGLGCVTMEPELETIFDKLKKEQDKAQQLEAMMEQMDGLASEAGDADSMMQAASEAGEEAEAQNHQENKARIEEQMRKLEEEMRKLADEIDKGIEEAMPEVKENMRDAMKEASQQAENLDTLDTSWGMDKGGLHRLPAAKRIELARKLNNDKFRRIAQLFGPMSRVAMAEQQRKVNTARQEIYDIELGNNLPTVLPIEMVGSDDEVTSMLFFKNYVEQHLLQYKLRGTEKVAKGGIIYLEDGSGSMSGDREVWAKAVGLSLLQVAKMQRRNFIGVHFGGPAEYATFVFDYNTNKITFTHRATVTEYEYMEGAIAFAELFFGGGPLRVDQRVVTDNGWKAIGEVQVDDYVYGPDGMPTKVIGVYPQGKLQDVYRVTFKDGAEVICDGNHIWTVKKRHWKDYRDLTLNQIIEDGIVYQHDNGSWFNYSVPMSQPVDLPTKEYDIHPYLLGYLLGDGTLAGGRGVSIASSENEYPWKQYLPDDIHVTTYNDPCPERAGAYGLVGLRGSTNSLIAALDKYGLKGKRSKDKFVPEDYLWGSIEQRLDLLSGLLDSDGCSVQNSGFGFSNISENLAKAVVQLTQSLGGVATISQKNVRPNEQPLWRVLGRLDMVPFKLTRKIASYTMAKNDYTRSIVSVEPIEAAECICIKVEREDGLFLTEGFVTTHNTDYVTPFTVGLEYLQKQYDNEGAVKGDIVMATDGCCGVPDEWMKDFKEKQAELDFKVYGLMIGGNPKSEPLWTLADTRVETVQNLVNADDARVLFRGV